jgi:hypothetical protein
MKIKVIADPSIIVKYVFNLLESSSMVGCDGKTPIGTTRAAIETRRNTVPIDIFTHLIRFLLIFIIKTVEIARIVMQTLYIP